MSVAAKRAAALLAGEPMSDDLAAEWAKADELVLSKLRERLGFGELRWAVSGAAPIPKETLAFFAGIGVPIAEVWGMSELSAVATASHPRDARLGSRRQTAARAGGQDRRGRRVSGPRPAGDEGLPQGTGEDRGGDRRRRLAAHRRHLGGRRRRLSAGGRPQEGVDHQCGRKEHVAGQHREHHPGRVPDGRRDDRRSATGGRTTPR